jgi:class 3 adenylate cyclase
LIDRVSGDKPLLGSIRQDIIERTDGIPLFVEEMTKAVLEAFGEGATEGAVGAIPSPAVAVPASLHASLMARLDRLGSAKEIAQIGAVIGREFSHALLAAVARKSQRALESGLERLIAAGLLFRQGVPPHATYLFKHALVQDAAYGTLLRSSRQQLHERIASALETEFPEIIAVQPELLARHCTEAGLDEQATGYWRTAGERAIRRANNREAIGHFRQALALNQKQASNVDRSLAELAILSLLGPALMSVHGWSAPEVGTAQHQRCSRLLVPLRVIFSQSSRQSWRMQRGFARPILEMFICGMVTPFIWLLHITRRASSIYQEGDPQIVEAVELGKMRTCLGVPMLKDNNLIGAVLVFRQEVRLFTANQIALITNFAAQAVIAIENARLLKELRERTEEVEKLNQHLEQRVTDQVDEIERMSRLRRFLPPQVADLIVASGSEKQLESHRREITALFCDLRGFTGFSESADPEDVMTLLREYHEAIGESIIKYSGTLERYAGDGVMVVFNDPVPVENPALQAVLMALEMRDAIAALTETWRRWGHDIGFGIGIAHGFATLGTIGFEGRFDYAAIGTVSNVASRLCDEAKPGQILISPRVLTKVEDAVKVEPAGEFELKGIRRPLAAYNVIAAAL